MSRQPWHTIGSQPIQWAKLQSDWARGTMMQEAPVKEVVRALPSLPPERVAEVHDVIIFLQSRHGPAVNIPSGKNRALALLCRSDVFPAETRLRGARHRTNADSFALVSIQSEQEHLHGTSHVDLATRSPWRGRRC